MAGLLEIDRKSSRSLSALQCIQGGAKPCDGMKADMLEWVLVVELDPSTQARAGMGVGMPPPKPCERLILVWAAKALTAKT